MKENTIIERKKKLHRCNLLANYKMPFPFNDGERSIGIEWIYAADSDCLILHSIFPLYRFSAGLLIYFHPSQLALLKSLNFRICHSSAGTPLFIPEPDSCVPLPNLLLQRQWKRLPKVIEGTSASASSMIRKRSLSISISFLPFCCMFFVNELNLSMYVCYLHRFLLLRGWIFPVRGKCRR